MCLIQAEQLIIHALNNKFGGRGNGFVPPKPYELAQWMGQELDQLVRARRSHTPPPTHAELASLIVALAYGPQQAVSPPPQVLAAIQAVARFPNPVDQHSIERAMVYGALLPQNGPSTWESRWPGSVQRLQLLVHSIIAPHVRWLHEVVYKRSETREEFNLKAEVSQCAHDIVVTLLGYCYCHASAEQLSIPLTAAQQVEVAVNRCQRMHRLAAWDGDEPLEHFLSDAALFGRLAGNPSPQIRGFRYSLLAAHVFGGLLCAGRILRCDCRKGEIRPADDRCTACGKLTEVTEPEYWLWMTNDRVLMDARRCGSETCRNSAAPCGGNQNQFIYFNHQHPCPRQGQGPPHNWVGRLLHVWVPANLVWGLHPDLADHASTDPALEAEAHESWRKCIELLDQLPRGPDADLAEVLFRQRLSVVGLARSLGSDLFDPQFLGNLADVLRHFRSLLPLDFAAEFAPQKVSIAQSLYNGGGLEDMARICGCDVNDPDFLQNAAIVLIRATELIRAVEPVDCVEED